MGSSISYWESIKNKNVFTFTPGKDQADEGEKKMEQKENVNEVEGSWDKYASGVFLKAATVTSEEDAYVCVEVVEYTDPKDKSVRPRLTLQRDGNEWLFDLNKTNSRKAEALEIKTPNALIGKKIYFEKALAMNPTSKVEVKSLRIKKIETPREVVKKD